MTDGSVQVAAEGTGKRIDTSELTRADGTVVERQRMVLADPTDPTVALGLTAGGDLPVADVALLLLELRRITARLDVVVVQLALATGTTLQPEDFRGT